MINIVQAFSILFLLYAETSNGHAYLSKPLTRNALMVHENGLCSWDPNASIPCNGNPHSLNEEEPITGCGIIQGRDPKNPTVYGSGKLGYANTGYKTTYTQGELVPMTVTVGTYHGGIFQFRIQDVLDNADPDGSIWDSLPLLKVESFSPQCDKYVDEGHTTGCGRETCVQEKTCAAVPLQPYGPFEAYKQDMMVQLPKDLSCKHCVLQWRYISSNSCWPDWTHCPESEKFWNCADIEIIPSNPAPTPSTVPTSPIDLPWDLSCLCQFETGCVVDSDCCSGQICADLGGEHMSARLCVENPTYYTNDFVASSSCKKTVTSPTVDAHDSNCQVDSDCCNPSAKCGGDGMCRFPDTCKEFASTPTPFATVHPTVHPTAVPTEAPTLCPPSACYASIQNPSSWYVHILDDWCMDDCKGRVSNCVSGCRNENTRRLSETNSVQSQDLWTQLREAGWIATALLSTPPRGSILTN